MKFSTILTGIMFTMASWQALSQATGPVVTGDYSDRPLQEVFEDVEQQSGLQFFYHQPWVDSVKVTAVFRQTPISTALATMLEGSTLSFHQIDGRIIITNNAMVINQPTILQSFSQSSEVSGGIAKGLVFAREYQDQTDDQSDLENYVFEIGNRNSMKTNGSSTIAGYVKSAENGEPVVGALVYLPEPFTATSSDESGFYSLTLPNGKHKIMIQYVGMKTTQRNVVLFSSGKLNIDMDVDVIALQEVTIESDRDINVKSVQMGVNKINIEEVKTVPIVLGENDILKIATTKAGVQTVGEGASGFNVRGGKADQNLILINDAPVYNASHFFGFFSVFNSDAIENMELYKSGIPSKFGGRLSSVFDIQAKSASKTEFKGQGGISPITSKMTLEIPLIKDKTSLLLGGRTTYSNWVLSKVKSAGFNENRVSFYDLITQVDHKIDDKNDLRISAYVSHDKFRLSSDTLFSFSNFSFDNINGSARWTHKFTNNLEGAFSAIYSDYHYDLQYDESAPNAFTQNFGINEATAKADFDYYMEENRKITFGASVKRYDVNPGQKIPLGQESLIQGQEVARERGIESAVHLASEIEINDFSIYGGIRYVMFNAVGPQKVYTYESGLPKNSDTEIDSAQYGPGEIIKTYHGPEWRFSGRYTLNNASSLKLSLSRTRQYIHSLSNSASLSPTDTWRLSSEHIAPQTADQVALGYYRNMFRNRVEISIEGYYRLLQNLVDFKTGSTYLLNQKIEREVLQGPGKSYGIEFSLTKSGRLNGWLNYAYARTFIKLDGNFQEEIVNDGKFFPTGYDKPHTINLVANYKLTRRFSFSLNTTYNTGRPVTFPVAAFDFKGSQNIHFSDRNAFRIPDYFRIDLGINLEGNHKIQKLSHSFWSLSIYNLTGRDNPFSVFFDVKNGQIHGSQLIVFGNPIPTLSYNFKF